jgi:tetratricopeptide (TPR) repeat protein
MTARVRALALVVVIVGGLALAAATLYARDTAYSVAGSADQFLYLRSSRIASRVLLSFKGLAADVYWMRAIQHYGRERKSGGQFALLQPLLDLTTTLDPRFNIAYRFGAIFLSLEAPNGPARPDQAIALLEKGLANNPNRWQYAHDIAFIYYWYTGDKAAAATWFEKAAAMPDAPAWIRPLAATMMVEGGNAEGAREMLNELRAAPEKYIRDAADRGLNQLKALDDLAQLHTLLDQFVARTGSYPADLAQLMRAAGYNGVPADPTGVPYAYDPVTHALGLTPRSLLNPLPKAFQSK